MATECYALARGICAHIHCATAGEKVTTCELWRGPIHLNTGLTTRHPKDKDDEAIAVTTALARALMMFYGRPSLFTHLEALRDQMLGHGYKMLLRQIAEEVAKRNGRRGNRVGV